VKQFDRKKVKKAVEWYVVGDIWGVVPLRDDLVKDGNSAVVRSICLRDVRDIHVPKVV
jgi:hypothetical protein